MRCLWEFPERWGLKAGKICAEAPGFSHVHKRVCALLLKYPVNSPFKCLAHAALHPWPSVYGVVDCIQSQLARVARSAFRRCLFSAATRRSIFLVEAARPRPEAPRIWRRALLLPKAACSPVKANQVTPPGTRLIGQVHADPEHSSEKLARRSLQNVLGRSGRRPHLCALAAQPMDAFCR